MGEESTWFDFLPGLPGLTAWSHHFLGRTSPQDAFYFRGGPFGDSHYTLTHVLSVMLVLAFVTIGGLSFSAAMRKGGEAAIVPPPRFSLRNLFEIIGDAVWSLCSDIMGEKKAQRYLPLIGTLACFIFFSNMLSLIPGMAPPTATLKTNVALALTVFVLTHIEGVRAQGPVNYIKHFLGPKWWLAWLIFPIEIVGHLARPISLSVRLMGNMFADHGLVSVFFFLVPLLVPVPFLLLGTMVVLVQTLVFCLLTMVYLNTATETHDDEHHEDGHEHGHDEHAHGAHA